MSKSKTDSLVQRSADTQKLSHNLDTTNYDDSEFIFSWNRDTPMIRPNLYKCPSCDHTMKRACDGTACARCGYPVALYGYRDLDYGNDNTNDEVDERPYAVNDGSLSDDIENERIPDRRVHFSPRAKVINYTRYNSPQSETDDTMESNKVVSQVSSKVVNPEDLVEGMDGSSFGIGGGVSGLCCCVCLLLFLIWLAWKRGDLAHKNGSSNLSLMLCIVILPYFYLSYVLVDWATAPGK